MLFCQISYVFFFAHNLFLSTNSFEYFYFILTLHQVIFVLDGKYNLEKENVHLRRNSTHNRLTNSKQKVQNHIQKKSSSPSSIAQIRLHYLTQKMHSFVPYQFRYKLAAAAASPTWISAPGEADLEIARRGGPESVIFTSDSDLLVYENTKSIIKRNKDGQFVVIERTRVLKKLNVTSRQFQILCALSGNDYAANIINVGINSLLRWYVKPDSSVQSIVKYLAKKGKLLEQNVDDFVRRFERALSIFTKKQETYVYFYILSLSFMMLLIYIFTWLIIYVL